MTHLLSSTPAPHTHFAAQSATSGAQPHGGHDAPEVNTNKSYAFDLYAFYLANGHYAPSITYGGAGLTRWARLMRASNGASGLKNEGSKTAVHADMLLRALIPNFSWEGTQKAKLNLSRGLSHNGLSKAEPVSIPGERAQEVMLRAKHSRDLPLDLERVAFIGDPGSVYLDFFQRAAFFQQAVRVHVFSKDHPAAGKTWFLRQVNRFDGSFSTLAKIDRSRINETLAKNSVRLELGFDPDCARVGFDPKAAGTLTNGIHLHLEGLSAGFSDDFSRYELTLAGPGAERVVLDYDVCLADQLFIGASPRAGKQLFLDTAPEHALPIDWSVWCNVESFPGKPGSLNTTANATFNDNMAQLNAELDARRDAGNSDVHIAWGRTMTLFKFVEHMRVKALVHALPPSHVERLCQLDFTWGRDRMRPCDIVNMPPHGDFVRTPHGQPADEPFSLADSRAWNILGRAVALSNLRLRPKLSRVGDASIGGHFRTATAISDDTLEVSFWQADTNKPKGSGVQRHTTITLDVREQEPGPFDPWAFPMVMRDRDGNLFRLHGVARALDNE